MIIAECYVVQKIAQIFWISEEMSPNFHGLAEHECPNEEESKEGFALRRRPITVLCSNIPGNKDGDIDR